ncbi:hypothetical protein CEB3_c02610 [Peptococcaceae bacterium CEB3]|nr:hypothetical protein CEB3_c10500 [Peptococcaceae bacterium CEB3]KLU63391.1 hypothetical protein CEB3_c02610 [Peptococcaceae bacterium CEB3]
MKIPEFKNEKDEAAYWDTHSAADVLDELENVVLEPTPELKEAIKSRAQNRLKMVSLRLREDQIRAVKDIAAKKDIPYQTLLRSWINEAIHSEQHSPQ